MKTSLLLTTLFIQLCLHSAEASGTKEVVVCQGESATLSCMYDEQRFSLQNHYFSWQRQKTMVYWFEYGKAQDVEGQYRDRASSAGRVESGNLSIQIHNIAPRDEDRYTCYIFEKQQQKRKKIGECEVLLLVNARYSRPTLVGPNPKRVQTGDLVNLTCHSSGGYPKPTVNWTDGENRPLLSESRDEFSQDDVSRLWNISSVIRVEVSANSSFACTVINTRTDERTISPPWSINIPGSFVTPSPHVPTDSQVAIIVLCVVLCFIVFCGLCFLFKFHRQYTGVPNREVAEPPETNNIEVNEV